MATTNRLSKIFQAIAARDWERAKSIAGEICDDEGLKGHQTAARMLRGALQPNGSINGALSTQHPRSDLAVLVGTALTPIAEPVDLADVELRQCWRTELEGLIREWLHRDTLRARGLEPRSKLFFHGPPGCGKSLTAGAMGKELSLPTFVVRFDAVIGAYLGQTAVHLRQLFHFAETSACVLVLDELDALGKKRGNPLEVGELDRIVIALMQELEHARPSGLIVATSNLPEHLDAALWRRFDAVIEFPRPEKTSLLRYGKRLSTALETPVTVPLKKSIESCNDYAEAKKIVEAQARRIALKDV